MVRLKHLTLDDSGPDAGAIIGVGAGRAFPPAPEISDMEIGASFITQAQVLDELLDPLCDGHWTEWRGSKPETHGPWVAIRTGGHLLLEIGAALERLEQDSPGLGKWIAGALDSPLSIAPPTYRSLIESEFWMGEPDESVVKEDCGDEYTGPTVASIEKEFPPWALDSHREDRRNRERYIREAQRRLGVNMAPLFKPNGEKRAAWSSTWRLMGYERWYPALFVWRKNDTITAAIDEIGERNANCGTQSDVAAVFHTGADLKRGARLLADAWTVLETYQEFADAVTAYRQKHKLA